MDHKKNRVLYLATFDPTVSATGTATRGKLFLRFFNEHYETHLVHIREKHNDGRDQQLINDLASVTTIDYSPAGYFLFSKRFFQAAKEALLSKQFDFIFADFEKAGWYAYLLSKKLGIPYVYNSHNVEFLRYIDFAKRNPLRYPLVPYMYHVEKKACQNALFTVAISEKDASSFRKWVPDEKVLAMPCAFDERQFSPFYQEEKSDPPVVLMVGNYRNPGNREGAYLLSEKIVPQVLKKHPDTVFRCIGRDFPTDIKQSNVEALGFVDDLMSEYKKASVVVVPITMGGGIKIKAIEGLASGKFVVSTPKGMEGIDTSNLENLQVLPIEQFANCINDVLTRHVGKTEANWDEVKGMFGTNHQLLQLKERIDAATRSK